MRPEQWLLSLVPFVPFLSYLRSIPQPHNYREQLLRDYGLPSHTQWPEIYRHAAHLNKLGISIINQRRAATH